MGIGKLFCAASMAVAVCALAPGGATAGTVFVTVTGTLTSGYDQLGEFGAAGGDLAGASYKAVFSIDVPSPFTSTDGSSIEEYTVPYADGTPSLGSVKMTINGISEIYDGSGYGDFYKHVGDPNEIGVDMQSVYPGFGICNDLDACNLEETGASIYNFYGQSFGGLSLTQPGNYSPEPNDYGGVGWDHYIYNPDTGGLSVYSYATGTLSNMTISDAVPEPAIWGLMISGFGLAGAALRRRRRAVAT